SGEERRQDRERDEPRPAVAENDSRDRVDEAGERRHRGLAWPRALRSAARARGASATPASPSSIAALGAPSTAFDHARLVPVASGTKERPLSRLTSTVPAAPARSSVPS